MKTKQAAKHTPGPWEVCPGTGVVYRAGRFSRADVVVKSVEGYDLSARPDTDRREANARLIAAAPDLLEAAKHADEAWCDFMTAEGGENGGMDRVGTAIVRLRAAIAKAEGR